MIYRRETEFTLSNDVDALLEQRVALEDLVLDSIPSSTYTRLLTIDTVTVLTYTDDSESTYRAKCIVVSYNYSCRYCDIDDHVIINGVDSELVYYALKSDKLCYAETTEPIYVFEREKCAVGGYEIKNLWRRIA